MAPNIFLTAATGYIGGTVLDTLVRVHPEYNITALLRKEPEGFRERYPNVKIVKGTFDDTELIASTAYQNDIVIHGGKTKHAPSLKAHIEGLLRRDKTSFLIRLAGTSIIADFHTDEYYGKLNPKVWSDIDDIDAITSFPLDYQHREYDKIIQDAAVANGEKLKCAIICPPGIYGPGRGPGNTQSQYLPEFHDEILKLGAPFYTQDGTNRRGWVHVDDLMKVYLGLVEAAATGGGNAVWGKNGYYFAESQEHSQIDMAREAGKILKRQGLIKTDEPVQLPLDTIRDMRGGSSWFPMGYYTWAGNTRTRGDRTRKYLGYKPDAPGLYEAMEADFNAALAVRPS